MVWASISLESQINLYLILKGTINVERYINEMFATYVVPHTELVEAGFLLMHDNACSHAALRVREYLNANILQMQHPPHS